MQVLYGLYSTVRTVGQKTKLKFCHTGRKGTIQRTNTKHNKYSVTCTNFLCSLLLKEPENSPVLPPVKVSWGGHRNSNVYHSSCTI